jgi:hypothetical protein
MKAIDCCAARTPPRGPACHHPASVWSIKSGCQADFGQRRSESGDLATASRFRGFLRLRPAMSVNSSGVEMNICAGECLTYYRSPFDGHGRFMIYFAGIASCINSKARPRTPFITSFPKRGGLSNPDARPRLSLADAHDA